MKGQKEADIIGKINTILGSMNNQQGPGIKGIFIDETLREFFYLKEPVVIPSIPVSSISHDNACSILEIISRIMPGFLSDHVYMEKRNPPSEEHSIHLASVKKGRVIDFIHILRLDFKFTANSGRIVKMGDSATFPSYSTDRIYFRSRLVPSARGGSVAVPGFLRLKGSVSVESETSSKRIITSVLFDDFSSREISLELSRKAGDIFSIPVNIYPMISYDYFTACMNIPDPAPGKIEKAAVMYEPLFLYLFADVAGADHELIREGLNAWPDCIEGTEGRVSLKPVFSAGLKEFFSCYSLFADDELMLWGWKRIALC